MRNETAQIYHERILRVLVYIQNHLDEALDLEALAGVANFSPFHFHRIFTAMVGESVLQHIRRIRLERAATRLKHSEASVTRIAFEAGYETHESFTRSFRSHFGESPSDYRQSKRIEWPPAPSRVHFTPDGRVTDYAVAAKEKGNMNVEIKTIPPMHVAFIRHVGPYLSVGRVWERLCSWAGSKGLFGARSGGPALEMLGVSHDDPEVTPPDQLRYDACITVSELVQAQGEVGVQDVGGGEYAVFRHVGPYEKLNETYHAFCAGWLPTSGRELRTGPALEMYRNSPMNASPDQLITDICMPLEPARGK